MAEKNYVVSLSIDDKGAVAAVNDMTTALNKADTSSQSLKAQLRQMQQELQKLDVGSVEFQRLSEEAGKLKDKINDASEAVRANAGGAFESLSNNASLLKDRLFNLDLEGVGQSFRAIAGNIKNFTFKEFQEGISAAASGIGALGKALLTNPIFVLGGVLAALVIYWEDIDQALKSLNPELERQKKLTADLNAELNNQSKQVGTQLAQAEALFGAVTNLNKSDEDRRLALDAINKLYPDLLGNQEVDINNTDILTAAKTKLVAAIEAEAKANAAKALLEQKFAKQFELQVQLEQQRLLLTQAQAKESEILATSSRNSYAEIQQFEEKTLQASNATANALAEVEATQKTLATTTKDIGDIQAIVNESIVAGAIATANKQTQVTKESKQKQKEITIEAEQSLSEIMAMLTADNEAEIEANNKALADRVAAIWQRANELSKAAQLQQASDIEAIQLDIEKRLDERGKTAREIEMQNLQDKYFEQKTMLENAGQETTALTELYESEQAAIKEKYAKEDQERKEKNKQFAIDATQQGLSTIQSLTELFGKKGTASAKRAFAINKAASIAQATISTYQSATSAYQSQFVPVPDPSSPVRGAIAAGLAVAAGIANIAKISSQKFEGGGGGSGGGGGGSVPSIGGGGGGNQPTVPAFNALNLGLLQNRPEQTPKAYVLAQDVSTAVEARDKVRDLARIN